MATTLSTDLYRPQVWADLAQSAFTGMVVVAGGPAVQVDDRLVGQPGDTIYFPKWMNLTDMVDLAETDVLVPEKLRQSNSAATIKEAGKAVEWTDKAKLTGIGNVQDEAIRQFGILTSRKVDADLIAAATQVIPGGITYADGSTATASSPKIVNLTGGVDKLTYAQVVGIAAGFGDAWDPTDFAGLYINSATWANIMKATEFITAAQLATGSNAMLNRGQVGQIFGLNVVVTDRLATGKALLLKNNALGLMYKRRPIVEQDRDILSRTTVVATNMHYGVKRLNDDGVVAINMAA